MPMSPLSMPSTASRAAPNPGRPRLTRVGLALICAPFAVSSVACTTTPNSTGGVDQAAAETRANAVQHESGPVSDSLRALLESPDRTPEDRESDVRRHPGELLTFISIAPGMRVADLGAGGGYTTELLARAVGPEGVVYAQNNAYVLEKFVSEKWPARLARPINKNVVRADREFEMPLPEEATDLDLVVIIFSYHDVVAGKGDRVAMNKAIFDALKPGGHFIIADHDALPGSGVEAASELHRLEQAVVRSEVSAAGFVVVDEANFLRDPTDMLTQPSFKIGFKTDRYLLKFQKPAP